MGILSEKKERRNLQVKLKARREIGKRQEGKVDEGVVNIGIRHEPTKGGCGYYSGIMMNTGKRGKENREIRKGRQNNASGLKLVKEN